jgi:hypothetical protein
MSVHADIRSPVAIAWTLVAIVAIGAVVAIGWRVAAVLVSVSAIADPAFLGGLGEIVVVLLVAIAVLASAGIVWLPCSAAIAHAVGRETRDQRVTIPGTVAVIRARAEPLYRWAKTRVAIGPIAERLLTENDVGRPEIAVGCGGFVVPALVLDASTLPAAVERANRIVPVAGRRRIQLGGAIATAALAFLGWAVGTMLPIESLPAALALALVGVVVGAVVTAAFDIAWRTETYATANRDDGFSG